MEASFSAWSSYYAVRGVHVADEVRLPWISCFVKRPKISMNAYYKIIRKLQDIIVR
jgi:hypothetical protein